MTVEDVLGLKLGQDWTELGLTGLAGLEAHDHMIIRKCAMLLAFTERY